MRAAIALGSNLPSRFGSPADNLREAVRRLHTLGTVLRVSGFLETDPVGYMDQPRFVNAAVLLETKLQPPDLLHSLLALESAMGRVRAADTPPKGPRTIDLDLLLYEDARGVSLKLDHPDLVLPHAALHERAFVLTPLAEIAPDWTVPGQNASVAALARAFRIRSGQLAPDAST